MVQGNAAGGDLNFSFAPVTAGAIHFL